MDTVRISQCMIVKNEEKNIERALSWGRGVVWEQIVVDTGSTDKTVEIARQMGAKIYEFSWIDDFAAAKNYAISKAEGEWIAFLDADEYLTREDGRKLLACVEKLHPTGYDGIMAAWVHMDGEGGPILGVDTQIRVFRNVPTLRYRRRIHEYLSFTGDFREKNADLSREISIYHTGYGKEAREAGDKGERNRTLIKRELEADPQDHELWVYLGNEYDSSDMWQEAAQAYQKALDLMPERADEFDITVSRLFLRYLNLLIRRPGSDKNAILKLYERAVRVKPKEADYDYLVGQYLAGLGDYRAGEKHLRRALELLETHGSAGKAMLLSAKLLKAYELLAACCFNNGDLSGCVRIATAMLKENPYLMTTAVILLSAFQRDDADGNKAEGVAAFLGQSLYDFGSLKDKMFLLRAGREAGYEALVENLRGRFTAEELAAVDQAFGEFQRFSV